MATIRTYSPHALLILGLALFASSSMLLFSWRDAHAASFIPPPGYVPLKGYLWAGFLVPGPPDYASGPGWISFSGTAQPPSTDTYGVYENLTSGALAGYAWSSNYGWISFDPSTSDGSHPPPSVNVSTGKVTGWARACAAFQSGCSGALNTGTGGPGDEWDGWISLSDPIGNLYGITQGAGCSDWSGHAWGSADIGWVSADAADVGAANVVKCATSPITVSCTVTPGVGVTGTTFVWKVASVSGGTPPYTYFWSGTDFLAGSGTSVTKTYGTAGPKTGQVRVTDSLGNFQTSAVCQAVDGSGNPISPPQTGIVVYQAPTATLTASKYTIVNGQSTTLTWSSTNATSCTGSGFSTGGATSGNAPVSPSVDPTNYGVTCSNPGGSASDSVSITVKKPTVTIGANPARVSSGAHTKIFWTSIDTTDCTVTGNGVSANGLTSPNNGDPNSGIDSGEITQQTVFKISCTTNGNPVSAQVIVNILPVFQEF